MGHFRSRLSGLRLERMKAVARYVDGRFQNTHGVSPGFKTNPLSVFGEFIFGRNEVVPRAPLPVVDPLPLLAAPPTSPLRVTWLGHSTVVLELGGARVLTDPVWGQRVSPVSFVGPKRFHAAPVSLEKLPPIDAVLLSHDHYDHLCEPTVRTLASMRVPFVTSLGVGARLEQMGVAPALITELDWWETTRLARHDVTLTAAPCQHFSGRSAGDRNQTAWSSWVIASDRKKVFFSGDTGLTDEFAEVRRRLGPFDLVMLEVGAYHPAWGDIHLGPDGAMRAFEMLGGGAMLPVHWGTFNLALHAWDDPAERLFELASEKRARVLTPKLGETFEPELVETLVPWWREVTRR